MMIAIVIAVIIGIVLTERALKSEREKDSRSRLTDIKQLSRRVAREQRQDSIDNDRYRNMTQSEIDRYKRR